MNLDAHDTVVNAAPASDQARTEEQRLADQIAAAEDRVAELIETVNAGELAKPLLAKAEDELTEARRQLADLVVSKLPADVDDVRPVAGGEVLRPAMPGDAQPARAGNGDWPGVAGS